MSPTISLNNISSSPTTTTNAATVGAALVNDSDDDWAAKAQAAYEEGEVYLFGRGGTLVDEERAVKCFRRAAFKYGGHIQAQVIQNFVCKSFC